ncbi:MAG: aminotransferase class V-fold PLP-dependent enzyme [Acidobacteria bacterium]|jgi:isopenicillin-N epimerase|nr:aminotransferase class V-fold PLP-dependent enzyme [Acidobacteriota bacterium]
MAEILTESELAQRWMLDPDVIFLNHGSFGATPIAVLEEQARIRHRIETEPLQFFDHHYLDELDRARAVLGEFLGATTDGLAFLTNATTGVNTVLNNIRLQEGEELLVTDHEYNACRNAINAAAERAGARVLVVRIPFPLASEDEVVERILDGISERTRLLLVDHVTSQTGLVLPIGRLVREVQGKGVDVLVDGAHAPGMVSLDLDALGAAYYTGNCHKWLCAPKGAAFLYVRADLVEGLRPLVISHGANAGAETRSRFHLEHDWTGTRDPSAWLAVPSALREMESMVEGGWEAVLRRNRKLVLKGRESLCETLGIDPPCQESMIGSLASLPLPAGDDGSVNELFPFDRLQERLFTDFRIEVPVISWPSPPNRVIRISAQLYNRPEQYEMLGEALRVLLEI